MAKVVIVDSDFSDHELETKMAREAGGRAFHPRG